MQYIKNIKKGDVFAVRPGESIPVDGIVIEGISAVDESALTGESIPVTKNINDKVIGGTINKNGLIKTFYKVDVNKFKKIMNKHL